MKLHVSDKESHKNQHKGIIIKDDNKIKVTRDMSDSAQINLQRQLDKRNNNKLDQNISKHEADNLSQN